jgi:hypothetical protein
MRRIASLIISLGCLLCSSPALAARHHGKHKHSPHVHHKHHVHKASAELTEVCVLPVELEGQIWGEESCSMWTEQEMIALENREES